ncbi:hypothetical protein HanHA89_Chr06g0229281 [Helianthus annuus]|nr:hypothetical protein HanHA89_Chr06g0229281 [Helianthus annuus]
MAVPNQTEDAATMKTVTNVPAVKQTRMFATIISVFFPKLLCSKQKYNFIQLPPPPPPTQQIMMMTLSHRPPSKRCKSKARRTTLRAPNTFVSKSYEPFRGIKIKPKASLNNLVIVVKNLNNA